MFELGFEGEHWEEKMQCLAVPLPNSDKHVLVVGRNAQAGEFIVVTQGTIKFAEDQLMAACIVRDIIDNYGKGET